MFRHTWLFGLMACLVGTSAAPAQTMTSSVPSLSMNPPQAEAQPAYDGLTTSVSFIDSALPRTMFRLRTDFDYDNRRPTRADYIYSIRGFPASETRVDHQGITPYLEYAVGPWFSVFLEQPYHWVNPQINANRSGAGDLDFGFKFAFCDTSMLLATFMLRTTAPPAASPTLDSRHWAIEPELLVNFKIMDGVTIEGEGRYWVPLSDLSFAGDTARYGLGLVIGERTPEFWMTPVAEVVGWTTMGGLVEVVGPVGSRIESAAGQTIVNGNLGMRMGVGDNVDFYAGYSRAVTGNAWYRDLFRFEFRLGF
jgi:hypothetical protein